MIPSKKRVLRCALAVLATFLFTLLASAQTGTVVGTVLDAETGESIIGANVRIAGTAVGSTTDLDGRYEIRGVTPGLVAIAFSYIGYASQTVTGVTVGAGETIRLNLALHTEALGLDEVTVEARVLRNNEATLLRDRQKAIGVSDAISAEAISRSGAGDAAAAMSRVTGASVVGGKYVYVRGLGDRYSSTQLNGAPLPSADPDRQSFQLDLLPSNLLDHIVTLKTFTPDKPGNFSGGLVDVGTKDFPDALTFRLSYSANYVDGVSGGNLIGYEGSATDWLGFDDGARDLPQVLKNLPRDPKTGNVQIPRAPSRADYRANFDSSFAVAQRISDISKAFSPTYEPSLRSTPMNQSFSFAFGNRYLIGGRPLGVTASLSYARSATARLGDTQGQWALRGGNVDDIERLQPIRVLGDTMGVAQVSEIESTLGGLATVAYRPSRHHSVSLTYLQTQSGESEARNYTGYWEQSGSGLYHTRVLQYQQRRVQSIQARGSSVFGTLTGDWTVSAARNTQAEPDLRYFTNEVFYQPKGSGVDTTYDVNAPTKYEAPTRYFRDLTEEAYTAQLDLARPLSLLGRQHRLKVGGYYQDTRRRFRQQRFLYSLPGTLYDLYGGDTEKLFSAGAGIIARDEAICPDSPDPNYCVNSRGEPIFGLLLSEATAPRSLYDGKQTIGAGYVMLDALITRKLRFIGGVRLEQTDLRLTSKDSTVNFITDPATGAARRVGVLDNTDLLPSLSFVYGLTDEMNLRLVGTRTLARPTFRELAPYSNAEFIGGYVYTGNPDLKRTLISNADLRWEWFFNPGEIVAVSGFYKQFSNPIERVIRSLSSNDNVTSQNVPEARVYGVELEARKRLGAFAAPLDGFSLGLNLSLIDSCVDIPQDELGEIRASDPDAADTRPLHGQSPYVVNFDVSYERGSTAAGVFFNQVGDRLVTVTQGATPDIYEKARPSLDVSLSQQLRGGLGLTLRARNLLDADYREVQPFKGQDYVVSRYRRGRSFSVSVSYTL